MNRPLITNIQKYSIHDGEGIRTTVFFKGCPLSCKWCHNPETQSPRGRILFYQERCAGCGACVKACREQAVKLVEACAWTDQSRCTRCGVCVEECVHNAREMCGRTCEVSELVRELQKDRVFYETSHGGVTLSGGEVLSCDTDYVEALMKRLAAVGIRVNIDTCGAVDYHVFQRLLPYTDVFLYDLKLIDRERHRLYTGRDNDQILQNLERLSRDGAAIWVRIPVIGGVNDTEEEIAGMGSFLRGKEIHARQIHLLPYHNTGSGKYARIGRSYEGEAFYTPGPERMEELRRLLQSYVSCPVVTGG